jgi:hypothetical protein
LTNLSIEGGHRFEHGQAGADGTLGVLLLSVGVAKIDENAVAHILGDEAIEAADDAGGSFVIGSDNVGEVLGIEAG